jgi:photosystem II stability/assembly factor-like uncharacterized protein
MSKRVSVFLIPFLSLFVLGMRACEFRLGKLFAIPHSMTYGFPSPVNGRPEAVVSSEPIGVVVGDSGSIYSTRGRPPSPWIQRTSGTTQRLNFVAFYPFDTTLVYVVGNGGTILRSTNGGAVWTQVSSSTTRNLRAVTVPSMTTAFAVGDSGLILRSTNSGTSWSPRTSGTTRNLRCVHAINDIFILAAGEGIIVGSSNGGGSWTSRFTDPSKMFNKLTFARGSVGSGAMWAVGNAGITYRSTDLGIAWTSQTSTTTQNLNDVYFADDSTGVAVGDGGTVRNTTDGGATWLTDSYLNSLTTENIKCIAPIHFSTPQRDVFDSITVTGIAGNGILTVSTEPLTQVFESRSSLPSDFALHQNYPNPFNPTTRIKFALSTQERDGVRSFVSLKVFDLVGHEVATLVNEELAPGVHERPFDGTRLASGVYLYQLNVGNRTDVKKLVLLK